MRCPQIERILIGRNWEQSTAIYAQIQTHLKRCPQCRRFAEELQILRIDAAVLAATTAPEALSSSVLSKCKSKLQESIQSFPRQIPVWVRTCTGLLCLLTMLWAYPVIKDLVTENNVHPSTGLVVTLVIQNAIMLLFAPLIIRIFRDRAQKSQYWFLHAFRRN
jgi:predicted anti-sigma-YlaC factor YlaD